MCSKFRVSAPGKVILHGEYAVVFNKKAVAVSVGLFTTMDVERIDGDEVTFQFPATSHTCSLTLDDIRALKAKMGSDYTYSTLKSHKPIPLEEENADTIRHFVSGLKLNQPASVAGQEKSMETFLGLYLAIFDEPVALKFKIETELPVGAGLGSSASFATSLVAGMLLIRGEISGDITENDLEKINQWSYFGEKFLHGNPSGIDNYVTTFGGAVVFQKSPSGGQPITERFPKLGIRALLVNTTVARSTLVMIDKMNKMKSESFEMWQKSINDIGHLVERAVGRIRDEGHVSPQLILENHQLLQKLGASHPALDKIVDLAASSGLAGKLTGAGGGGCAFIFVPEAASEEGVRRLKGALEEAGFQVWDTKLGSRGVHCC